MSDLDKARYTAKYHYDITPGANERYKASGTMNEPEAFELLDNYIERLKSQLAAKTEECVALALGMEKIRDDGCELSHIDGNVCCLGEVYFPTPSKQIVEEHDRKVRAEVWREDKAWHRRAWTAYGKEGLQASIHRASMDYSCAQAVRAEAAAQKERESGPTK